MRSILSEDAKAINAKDDVSGLDRSRLYEIVATCANVQDGRTALHWAATTSSLAMTQLLLSHSPDIEARDTMGWTPLMIACASQLRRPLSTISADLDSRSGAV